MAQNTQYFFTFILYQKNIFFNGTKHLINFYFYIMPKKIIFNGIKMWQFKIYKIILLFFLKSCGENKFVESVNFL